MNDLVQLLQGGDLRSIGNSNKVVSFVNSQPLFDNLFKLLFHSDRKVVMRCADAIEKITLKKPEYLKPHKKEIVGLLSVAKDKELIWHLAQLIPRIPMNTKELDLAWSRLSVWLTDKKQSKIVRVNSLTSLHALCSQNKTYLPVFTKIVTALKKENIPSLNARIRILENKNFHDGRD